MKTIGHAGTLDPMATGVLVILVDEATKLSPYIAGADKAYAATLRLGVETDSLDADGRVTRAIELPDGTRRALERMRDGKPVAEILMALAAEQLRTQQVPPQVSAIKKDGERAYARARRGDETALEPREVTVQQLRLLDGGLEPEPWLAIALDVSKGYYVRAFARDLAAALGTVGHLTALRRTRSGGFTLEEAMPLDTPPDELAARVVPLARAAARALPVAKLTSTGARDAQHGRRVEADDLTDTSYEPHAWFAPDGAFIAVGVRAPEGHGRVLRGFSH